MSLIQFGRCLPALSSLGFTSSPHMLATVMGSKDVIPLARSYVIRNSPIWTRGNLFSTKSGKKKSRAEQGAQATEPSSTDEGQIDVEEEPSVAHLADQLNQREKELEALKGQVENLTDAFKRSLAEMENLRERTAREKEGAQKFAIQGFVKELLEVADNLERATASVPAREVEEGTLDAAMALEFLKSLLEGVQMTERVLMHVFKQHGVQSYHPIDEKFDPNLHFAIFEIQRKDLNGPLEGKAPGTVAVVIKRGYKLNDRVIRPAEVGVVKASS